MEPLCLSLLFGFMYLKTFLGLVLDWWNYPWNSHGFIVPVLVGYLLWTRKSDIEQSYHRIENAGLACLICGLILFLAGAKGEEELLARMSIPISLVGLIWYLHGWDVTRKIVFPVACLLFMIPIPYTLNRGIAAPLQLLDARLATYCLGALGVPVFREGVILHLPDVTLEVADLCSGIQSMVALVPLGFVYVHQLDRRGRPLLWLAIIPIAVLANIVRIIVTALLAHHLGTWTLGTAVHTLSGVFNFVIAFLALVGLARAFPKRGHISTEVLS